MVEVAHGYPLAPERYRAPFTASAGTYATLRLAQDLLRHQIPDGDLGQVLDRALTAIVQALARTKLAATPRPCSSRGPAPRSRHVPAAVWRRDGGRCAFVSREGRRCTERGCLEFHHVRPYAAGGEATVDTIQLRCRAHDGHEAERAFGPHLPWGVREPGGADARPHRAAACGGSGRVNSVRTELGARPLGGRVSGRGGRPRADADG